MIKIVFCHSLCIAGGRRIAINLFNNLEGDKNFYSIDSGPLAEYLDIDPTLLTKKKGKVRYISAFFSFARILKENNSETQLILAEGLIPAIFTVVLKPFFKVILISRIGRLKERGLLKNILWKTVFIFSDRVVSPTENALSSYHFRPNRKFKVIPNPVDEKQILMLCKPDGNFISVPYIIYVGRIVREKNIEKVIKTYEKIKKRGYLGSLVLVGGGEESYEMELKNYCKSLGLVDNVKFLGELVNPYHLIKQADVSLFFGEHEGFGYSVVESILLGTPVITSFSSSGHIEVLKKYCQGYLILDSLNDEFNLYDYIEGPKPSISEDLNSSLVAERYFKL